jgi:hypothetical protein
VKKQTIYRNNLFLLVFIHLFLFIYPTVDKAIHLHQHDGTEKKITYAGSPAFNTSGQDCPVCDFQFLNFVNSQSQQAFICPSSYSVLQPSSTSESFAPLFHYFLLRAPPANIFQAAS